jgi:hypothetical protein
MDIKKYISFLESYLESNNSPIYHLTNIYSLYDILLENILKRSNFDNLFNNKTAKIISFTRNPKLDLSHYRIDINTIIEIDTFRLKSDYKIIPYDFFIHNKKEKNQKWNTNREEAFEYEEIVLKDIINIKKYILSINFVEDSIFSPLFPKVCDILDENKIKILINGKEGIL